MDGQVVMEWTREVRGSISGFAHNTDYRPMNIVTDIFFTNLLNLL